MSPPVRHLVLCDLDFVLVDPRPAQYAAVAAAAEEYLEVTCAIVEGRRLVRLEHVEQLADAMGRVRGPELLWGTVLLLLSQLPSPLRPPPAQVTRGRQVTNTFATCDLRYGSLAGIAERRLGPLLEAVKARGGGVDGLRGALRHDTIEGLVRFGGDMFITAQETSAAGDRDRLNALSRVPEDVIGRRYQAHYLGDERFEAIYGRSPVPPVGAGSWALQRVLVDADQVAAIAEVADISIVTERTDSEARAALELAGLPETLKVHSAGPELSQDAWAGSPLWPIAAALADAQGRAVLCLSGRPDHFATLADRAEPVRRIGFAWSTEVRRPLTEQGASVVISRLRTLLRALPASPSVEPDDLD